MKLTRFDAGTGPRLGVIVEKGIVDLAENGYAFSSMIELIEKWEDVKQGISQLLNSQPQHQIANVKLLAPIHRPGKFLAIGMNYDEHVKESNRLGVKTTEYQYWFNKQTSCINAPYGEIEQGVTEKLDYEVELGVIIGKSAKSVSAKEAPNYIFGYLVVNDVSARDWQFHSPTFTMGKSFDTHGPIGPWIVTADEINDPENLEIRCSVNGETRQSSNTSYLIHKINSQIEYLSTAFTLEPGDILATGTPAGVGVGMDPQAFLQPGDIVRCEIESIGFIENRIKE